MSRHVYIAGVGIHPFGRFDGKSLVELGQSAVTMEQLAHVSVKNHKNGVHNPYAMFRKELSPQAVLGSPVVCDPLRLYMLCSPNEGAAAVVLSATPPQNGGPRVAVAAATLR